MRRVLLKTRGEQNNTVRFVVTEDNEPVFHGVFEKNNIYSETICSVRVKDRLTSRDAVFCDIGQSRNAFVRDCKFLPGKIFLAQAESAEHDNKGVRFTTDIMLRGKYVVVIIQQYSAKVGLNARVSRKIKDTEVKNRIHKFIAEYPERTNTEISFFCEVICRTAVAELEDLSVIDDDLNEIFSEWKRICSKFEKEYLSNGKVGIVEGCDDVLDYIVQHEKTVEFDEIISDSPVLVHELTSNHTNFSEKIKCFTNNTDFDIFSVYSVDNKLCQLLRKQVYLKSGAHLVIEYTEAMTVIDVNSGKNTVNTAFEINMEAATEIMRQLRLRDIGGIIVCDYINMPDKRVERLLVEYMTELSIKDCCELYISDVSRLGLVEVARKRN